MTNYEFGRRMHWQCHVARVRGMILEEAKDKGGICEASWGFVSVIRERATRSGADIKFLHDLDRALNQ